MALGATHNQSGQHHDCERGQAISHVRATKHEKPLIVFVSDFSLIPVIVLFSGTHGRVSLTMSASSYLDRTWTGLSAPTRVCSPITNASSSVLLSHTMWCPSCCASAVAVLRICVFAKVLHRWGFRAGKTRTLLTTRAGIPSWKTKQPKQKQVRV